MERIFDELSYTTRRVVPVHVNCQLDHTLFMVFARIFHSVFGHTPPTTGLSIRRLMNEIGNALVARQQVLLVCLDDANFIQAEGVFNYVLYPILRLYEGFPGVKSGVFLTVSNVDTDLRKVLDPSVMSVLQPISLSCRYCIGVRDVDCGEEIVGAFRDKIDLFLFLPVERSCTGPEQFDKYQVLGKFPLVFREAEGYRLPKTVVNAVAGLSQFTKRIFLGGTSRSSMRYSMVWKRSVVFPERLTPLSRVILLHKLIFCRVIP